SPIVSRLEQEGVTVIALAVGSQPDLAILEKLTGFNGGRVLPVADVLTLPRLMSGEVAAQRAPPVEGDADVVQERQFAFLSSAPPQWPSIAGYMVTRLRDGADLYLRSDRGDPLLAAGFAGAGRVAVLPGGLGVWAKDWWEWSAFDDFLIGLVQWLGIGQEDGALWLSLEEQPGKLEFTVDQRLPGAWDSRTPRLVLRDPAGVLTELTLSLQAPGRFRAEYGANRVGSYLATVQGENHAAQYGFFRNPESDLVDPAVVAAKRLDWLERGLLRPWPGPDEFVATLEGARAASRQILLVMAGLVYLCLLLWERGLLRWPSFKAPIMRV
ncbi:MAG: hypothetical protein ACK2U9_06960, partial [Anaerolineae bacterium]